MNLFFIFGDVLFGKVNKKIIISKIEKKELTIILKNQKQNMKILIPYKK